MAKRIIGALFIVIIFSVIVGLFASFGMAQNNANDGPAVELTDWWSNDNVLDPLDPPERQEDVAWVEGQLRDLKPDGDPDGYNDDFYFTIHDGYPGYECTLNLTVHNAGNETLWIHNVNVDVNPPSTTEVSVSGVSVSSTELAPDDHAAGGADEAVVIFTVTVLEGATQGTTYLNVIDGSVVVKDEQEAG